MFSVSPTAPRRSKGVAVRAKNSQILQTVIIGNAVDVIQFQGNRLTHPLCQPTAFALALLEPSAEQAFPKVGGAIGRVDGQDLL
jgi:hypothetical protein